MNELALFAGAGGGILGGILCGWRTVCAVEYDPYCREVLLRRQEEGHLKPFPIWDDVRTFDGTAWAGAVDIITAGFPCQPFSVAGRQAGADDPRNMWLDTIRIIREVRPGWVLLENVPGLLATGYIYTIAGELSEAGYDFKWDVVSAAETGAPHKRDRWWCLAHAAGEQNIQREPGNVDEAAGGRESINAAAGNGRADVPHAANKGLEGDKPAVCVREHQRLPAECGDVSDAAECGQYTCAAGVAQAGRGAGDKEQERQDGQCGVEGHGGKRDVADTEKHIAGRLPEREETPQSGLECDGAPDTNADGEREQQPQGVIENQWRRAGDVCEETRVCNSECVGFGGEPRGRPGAEFAYRCGWPVEPDVGRVANGVAYRVDRLKALGNGQVPRVVRAAWELLR